jgi:hypothetical protein
VIDVGFETEQPVAPPNPHGQTFKPTALRELYLGPRGFSLLSWLAHFKYPDIDIDTVVLEVNTESITPFQDYVEANGDTVLSLNAAFRRPNEVAGEFSPFKT